MKTPRLALDLHAILPTRTVRRFSMVPSHFSIENRLNSSQMQSPWRVVALSIDGTKNQATTLRIAIPDAFSSREAL